MPMSNLLIVWNETNNLGIPIIDEQHRGIVTAINSLHFAIRVKRSEAPLIHIVNIIREYSRLHFSTEEMILEHSGYPGLAAHRELHAYLTLKSLAVSTDSIILNDPVKYLKFLEEWWLTHINKQDAQYAAHVRAFYKL